MTSPAAANQLLTTAEAEIACIRGDAEILSQYLRQPVEPETSVIQNIALALLANRPGSSPGPGDLKLMFSIRNGRPPKNGPIADSAALAIANGQAIPLGEYLFGAPSVGLEVRLALASALDPSPKAHSRWRLRYVHHRRGFSRSQLKNELMLAEIGHRALKLRRDGKLWHQVYSEMPHAETLIKRAVRSVLAAEKAANNTVRKPTE